MSNIFIVEDEPSLLRLYEIILSVNGYKIAGKARNGHEAVEKYKNFLKKPDVIIMDHRMPVKTGLEATKEILEINPEAKIIIATADENIKEDAKSLGIISFKAKPFSNERLLNNVKKALSQDLPAIKS
jgi:two-component system chemotaxis response regulator CheY